MKSRYLVIIFALVAIVQLYVPASIIIKSESILKNGSKYLFKTAPIDPNDAFRGKYVQLSFEQNKIRQTGKKWEIANKDAYVEIAKDSAGFAKVTNIYLDKPKAGDFVKVITRLSFSDTLVNFDLPFNRFYLEEGMAERAEELYRKNNIRGKQDSYAIVRVKSGTAVIEDLWIGGKPIKESLKEK
jgi:uncharacterized membrane-anchored protein